MTKLSTYPIEDAFKEMCDNSPRNNYYFEKYIVCKNVLYDKIYSHVSESNPGFTDHSHKHIDGILLQIDRLCKERVDKRFPDDSNYINLYELYLLLMSIIFHDAGMLVGEREEHSDVSKIIQLFDSIILSDDEKYWIKSFIKCHQSVTKIEDEIKVSEKMILNWNIHPQFIAAMLRLADELDEHKLRSDGIGLQMGTIPEDQIIFHEFSNCVDGIKPKLSEQEIDIEISIQKNNLKKIYKKKGSDDISLINEIIGRVDKINKERKYCMKFTSYYIEYKEIDLKLFIRDNVDTREIRFIFDDRKDASSFWDANKSMIDSL